MTDIESILAEVRRLDAEATKGPWFYNSYSGVFSEPVSREYDVAVEALPDDAPAEAFDGLVEPCCAHVPVVGGDTATAQGARDAALIAAYRTAAPLLADECERLRACMAKAGLAAFMREGDPEAVAEHLRSVIDSYEKPAAECSRLQAEVTQLRAERDMPCAHRLEEERLQERVRVLEADYEDGGASTNRELARRLLAAEKRAMVLEGERDEAREWVRKMQRANTTTCIFCGLEQTGIDAEQLRAHAATCSRHPLRVLTEALRPFAECGPFEGFARDERIGYRNLTVGDFDTARAALEGIESP